VLVPDIEIDSAKYKNQHLYFNLVTKICTQLTLQPMSILNSIVVRNKHDNFRNNLFSFDKKKYIHIYLCNGIKIQEIRVTIIFNGIILFCFSLAVDFSFTVISKKVI
jgi:hypothetical protein